MHYYAPSDRHDFLPCSLLITPCSLLILLYLVLQSIPTFFTNHYLQTQKHSQLRIVGLYITALKGRWTSDSKEERVSLKHESINTWPAHHSGVYPRNCSPGHRKEGVCSQRRERHSRQDCLRSLRTCEHIVGTQSPGSALVYIMSPLLGLQHHSCLLWVGYGYVLQPCASIYSPVWDIKNRHSVGALRIFDGSPYSWINLGHFIRRRVAGILTVKWASSLWPCNALIWGSVSRKHHQIWHLMSEYL